MLQNLKCNVKSDVIYKTTAKHIQYFRGLMLMILLAILLTVPAYAENYPNVTLSQGSAGPGATGWIQQQNGSWNYMASGRILTGTWINADGKWYLLDSNGTMLTGLQNDGSGLYYLGSDGRMRTGWQNLNGTWYLFNSEGRALTGWQNIGGTYYLLGSDGKMLTGWQQDGGHYYLLDTDGKMLTGWRNVNGAEYYLAEAADASHPYGAMYASEKTPDGSTVDAQGSKVSDPAPRQNPTGYPTCVEVDITNQNMYCYVNNQLVLSSPCVTGRANKHDTMLGVHTINAKQTDRYLEGYNDDGSKYKSHVNYWMPFYKGQGLHDASWRSKFGGNIYTYAGSHGCVNLPPDIAAALYNIAYVGMPVVVHS
ncbi:L,D-transpeptidase family protein [Oribacterium sp. HCP28S3_H8]|uniref:L,D-transpeptidase n=1 Tax=Oribacterium sp. HCP28S3_H8 TaxID=3438945 RepID=UPI003F8C01AA